MGSVGERTIVESPFTCDYGYNINIGSDVIIERDCVILDPCKISIGDRCIIGPGVKFFGLSAPLNPRERNGNQGVFHGGPIIIEDDCFIGGNAVILANRIIKKGSVVGANTVVRKVSVHARDATTIFLC